MSGRAARARPERARPRNSAAPRELLDALRDLPAAVAPLIKRADATKAELRRVERLLAVLFEYAAHGSVDHDARVGVVLGDEQARLALLQVVGVVVRWRLSAKPARGDAAGGGIAGASASCSGGGAGASSSGGRSARTSHSQPDVPGASTARGANAAERWSITTGTMALIRCLTEDNRPPSPLVDAFFLQLLRMQTLQACARQLADAAPARTPAECLDDGLQRVLCCLSFLDAFGQNEHAAQLAFALRDSAVLEHAFRLLLRALAGDPPPAHQQDVVVAAFATAACTTCTKLSIMRFRLEDELASPAAAAVREVCSGTCLQHAVFVQLVATLCAADGGPAYGLPQELLRAVPIYVLDGGRGSVRLHSMRGKHRLCATTLDCSLRALRSSSGPSFLTPRASLVLLSRVIRLALTSAEARTAAGVARTAAARSGAPQPLQLNLAYEDATAIVISAIANFVSFLGPHEGRAWHASAVAKWWQLIEEVSHLTLTPDENISAYGLGVCTNFCFDPGFAAGPVPHPTLRAALDGGALRCVERWLRRLGDAPEGHEAAFAQGVIEHKGEIVLFALLVHGEASGAASLAATVCKLLRCYTGGDAILDEIPGLAAVYSAACGTLDIAVDTEALGDFGATVPHVLSYAASLWLPQLSRVAREALRPAPPRVGSDAGADIVDAAAEALSCVLRWLPLLAWRCAAEAALSSLGGSGAAAGSNTASPAADAGGWRALLVDELCAVQLLGDALQFGHTAAEVSDSLRPEDVRLLAASCCAVAAACPREVCAAVAAGAAGDTRWRPEALRTLLPVLQAAGRHTLADRAEALAAQVEAWAAGGDEMAPGARVAAAIGALAATEACLAEVSEAATEVVRLLVPPKEARGLLRTCSNPACTRLAGDSEAGQRLQACGGCGACMYDCRECQVAHWRTGHKEACARQHGA